MSRMRITAKSIAITQGRVSVEDCNFWRSDGNYFKFCFATGYVFRLSLNDEKSKLTIAELFLTAKTFADRDAIANKAREFGHEVVQYFIRRKNEK